MSDLFENWGEVKEALLEGLDSRQREFVSPILENQKNYALMETASGAGTGAVTSHDVAGFRKILIPMIRRIIPGTIASELVGVQPMSGPVGLVYSLRYKYAEAVSAPGWTVTAGEELFGNVTNAGDPNISRFYSGATNAAQAAGASGFTDDGVDALVSGVPQGHSWGSSLDSTVHTTGTALGMPVDGSLRGGSGSFLEGSGGRRLSLEVMSQAVEAGSRKLQAGWSVEAMQDLNSQHGLDLESEMTKALSAEIVQEIDNEIINDLIGLAGTVHAFDFASTDGPAYQPAYVGDRFANIGVAINRVATEIGRKTRRGVGNFIVVSPSMVNVLQSAAKSVFAPAVEGSFKGPNNTMLVGTLNGTIKVYSYLWNQSQPLDAVPAGTGADTILVGYKGGNGETDTGYFYCPYIPLMSSGVVVNPVTFQPVVSLMTRYGKAAFTDKTVSLGNSADYYGKIQVTNLAMV